MTYWTNEINNSLDTVNKLQLKTKLVHHLNVNKQIKSNIIFITRARNNEQFFYLLRNAQTIICIDFLSH